MKITGLAQQLTAVVYHRLDDAITELGGPAKSFGERLVLTADELQVQADLNVHRVVNWILLLDYGGPCTGSFNARIADGADDSSCSPQSSYSASGGQLRRKHRIAGYTIRPLDFLCQSARSEERRVG